jgi:hypothetical protein
LHQELAAEQAVTSRLYAVLGMVTAVDDPWRNPKGFSVQDDNCSAPNEIEQYLQQTDFTYNKIHYTATQFLSMKETSVWEALQLCYREVMFRRVSFKSARQVLHRISQQVSVIIALQKHLVQQGKTLHDQLADVTGSKEIPAKWLDELLPVV